MPYEDGVEWGWVRFGNAELHLYAKEDHDPPRTATGVPGTSDPSDTAYGMHEAVHVDLDPNLIRLGSPLKRG
jgi:hypothetical protein